MLSVTRPVSYNYNLCNAEITICIMLYIHCNYVYVPQHSCVCVLCVHVCNYICNSVYVSVCVCMCMKLPKSEKLLKVVGFILLNTNIWMYSHTCFILI